ncbi:MAG: hypothetical protein CV088_02350 [Nitrospira sp. LK70]|nr:hypothetical protein [Nitrospira sp. LK70]
MISPLNVCLRTVLALFLLLTLGCITPPVPVTPEQIASADYGAVPVSPAYQDAIKRLMHGILLDPDAARYQFVGEPQRGYVYLSGKKPPVFGYLVHVEINAKSMMGFYVGKKPYRFLIKNGSLYMLPPFVKAEAVQ